MLSLLREAIAHELTVRTDYDEFLLPPNQNSVAVRVAIVRPRPTGPEYIRQEVFT